MRPLRFVFLACTYGLAHLHTELVLRNNSKRFVCTRQERGGIINQYGSAKKTGLSDAIHRVST